MKWKKKLTDLPEIARQLEEKTTALNEINQKLKETKLRYDFIQSFLEFARANNLDEIEEYFNGMPRFIDTAKEKNADPEVIKLIVFEKLAGGALDIMVCGSCYAEFAIMRKPHPIIPLPYYQTPKTKPELCPFCGSRIIQVKKVVSNTIKRELNKPALH